MQQVTKNENTKSEPQNNHIKDTRVIIMSATSERSGEPQYYHIKDIRVVMISAIVGTSFLAAISIDCFKIAQILFF